MTRSDGASSQNEQVVDFAALARNAQRFGPRFEAAFDSDCAECGDVIFEGDDVGYLDNEVVCLSCYDLARWG